MDPRIPQLFPENSKSLHFPKSPKIRTQSKIFDTPQLEPHSRRFDQTRVRSTYWFWVTRIFQIQPLKARGWRKNPHKGRLIGFGLLLTTKSSREAQKSASKTRNAYFAKTSPRAPKTCSCRPEGDRGVPQPYEARETSFGKVVKQPSEVSNPSHNQIQNKSKLVTEKGGRRNATKSKYRKQCCTRRPN